MPQFRGRRRQGSTRKLRLHIIKSIDWFPRHRHRPLSTIAECVKKNFASPCFITVSLLRISVVLHRFRSGGGKCRNHGRHCAGNDAIFTPICRNGISVSLLYWRNLTKWKSLKFPDEWVEAANSFEILLLCLDLTKCGIVADYGSSTMMKIATDNSSKLIVNISTHGMYVTAECTTLCSAYSTHVLPRRISAAEDILHGTGGGFGVVVDFHQGGS